MYMFGNVSVCVVSPIRLLWLNFHDQKTDSSTASVENFT